MEIKRVQTIPRGMNQDVSISKFRDDLSFENYNIRIAAIDNSTTLSIENERGPLRLDPQFTPEDSNTSLPIQGYCIGYAVLNEYIVLFTTTGAEQPEPPGIGDMVVEDTFVVYPEVIVPEPKDFIYRIKDLNSIKLLYAGNLGFDPDYPIETLSYYENSAVQKVYWTDGLNQLRAINIVSDDDIINSWTDNSFNFFPELQLQEDVRITQSHSGGSFAAGVVQFAFSYYNLFGAETALAYVSDIRYLGLKERGLSPEEISADSFTLTVNNVDTNFQFIRLYAIHRTTLDATPTVRIVNDYPITGTTAVLSDNGISGEDADPDILLFLGGEEVVVGTITSKDNTLFGANIKYPREAAIADEVRALIGDVSEVFYWRQANASSANPTQPFESKADSPSDTYTYYPHLANNDAYSTR